MSHKAKQSVEASREQRRIISFAFHLSQLDLSFLRLGWLRADPSRYLSHCMPESPSSAESRI